MFVCNFEKLEFSFINYDLFQELVFYGFEGSF